MNTHDLLNLTPTDRRAALTAVAARWTDWLVDLGGNPRPAPFHTDVTLLATAVQPLCSPLFTVERISELMFLLSTDIGRLDRYENFGTWEGEDSILYGMTSEERIEFLTRAVDRGVFALMHGVEPCITCMTERRFEDWQPQATALRISPFRCAEHGDAEDEAWREWNKNHRALRSI